jgi:hypothetical protein
MRFVQIFEDQDTAMEFDRVLRNLSRRGVVRRRIFGSIRKNPSVGAYAISYEMGRRSLQKYVVSLLHKGNGVVDISVREFLCNDVTLALESRTDDFVQSKLLRSAIGAVARDHRRLSDEAILDYVESTQRRSEKSDVIRNLRLASWELVPFGFNDLFRSKIPEDLL